VNRRTRAKIAHGPGGAAAVAIMASVVLFSVAWASPNKYFRPSKYGGFEYRNKGDDCEIWFADASGGSTKVIEANFCADTMMVKIEEVRSFGGRALPVVAKSGEEFHIFQIPSARGGNATISCDYYSVVVNATKAWGDPTGPFVLRLCADMSMGEPVESVKLIDDPAGASLSFVEPAGTTVEGTSYELRMGSLKSTRIPMKPRSVVSDQTVVRKGTLQFPYHFTNFHHSIKSGADLFIIDDAGKCNLDPLVDAPVEMTGKLRTWSDKATELTCVSIRRTKP
jgi:hypothetical protein